MSALVERKHVAKPEQPDSVLPVELIKAMAMDIGKELVAYIEVQYPEAIKATSSTFKLSIRNHVYNDIMAVVELHNAGEIHARLDSRASFRKKWVSAWRKIRKWNKS